MNNWKILVPLVAATLIACGENHQRSAPTDAGAVRARLAQAERLEVPEEVEVHGTVEAGQTAAVSARVMAMVTAVRVRAGDRVRRGQVLLDIDPQVSEGQLSQARGALSQARAALALAERNLARFRALGQAEAASDLELDMARMQHEQAKGAVEQAEGAVAAASSLAADARVVAPFDGRVARKLVDVGDLAAPGRPLLMIESVEGRKLVAAVSETLMHGAQLQTGASLRVRVDSRPDLGDLTGRVSEMTPGADPASHSFQIKLELPVSDLTTGAAGRAWIPAGSRPAVVIPNDALLRQGGVALVAVRTKEGLASTRVVTIGRRLPDDKVEILSGLTGGETVLLGLTSAPPLGSTVEVL